MIVIMPPGSKFGYSEEKRICVDSPISLTEVQYRMESNSRVPGQDPVPVSCFVEDSSGLSKRADHLINREDDYLAGWLSVIDLYPGQPVENLPFFGALVWPAYSHDCLTQLSIMESVEGEKDKIGLKLTQKGDSVMSAYDFLRDISLSGISALADVGLRLQKNVARSALRLILLLEHYHTMVKEVAHEGAVASGEDLRQILEGLAASSADGGPARRHVDRGALWAAWVVFEDAFCGIDLSIGNIEKCFYRPEIFPRMGTRPFVLRAINACDYAEDVVFWEEKIGLELLPKGDWGGFELSDEDADIIQNLLAKSYYPFLLHIPFQLKGADGLMDSLGPVLHRSGSLVYGSEHIYALYMDMWAETVRQQAPSQSSALYVGLPAPPLDLAEVGSQIRANAVMIMPYETASSVDKDGLDTWYSHMETQRIPWSITGTIAAAN